MKITQELIREFESEQRQYGTEVAMFNLLWLNACKLLEDLGITSVHTRCPGDAPGVSAKGTKDDDAISC
jgi:hypothetical protein